MIEEVEHFALGERIKIAEVGDHAGGRIGMSGKRDLRNVIMAVTEGVIALAEGGAVCLGRERIDMQTVRRGE
jgi:hypothetical protein